MSTAMMKLQYIILCYSSILTQFTVKSSPRVHR